MASVLPSTACLCAEASATTDTGEISLITEQEQLRSQQDIHLHSRKHFCAVGQRWHLFTACDGKMKYFVLDFFLGERDKIKAGWVWNLCIHQYIKTTVNVSQILLSFTLWSQSSNIEAFECLTFKWQKWLRWNTYADEISTIDSSQMHYNSKIMHQPVVKLKVPKHFLYILLLPLQFIFLFIFYSILQSFIMQFWTHGYHICATQWEV